MLKKILQNNGFTKKEAKIYLAGLELGNSPVSHIAKLAGENRVTTYNILQKLHKQGISIENTKLGTKYYEMIGPEFLLENKKNKSKNLTEIIPKLVQLQKSTNNIDQKKCLITGCFDIIHIGHIKLFQFAKQKSNYLIVGLEHDQTIKLTKGQDRPINNLKIRTKILSEIKSIDEIFHIPDIIDYKKNQNKSKELFIKTLKQIKPDILITSIYKDPFWKIKKSISTNLGIKFIPFNEKISKKKILSTTGIIQKIDLI